jgi:hypothetical protein
MRTKHVSPTLKSFKSNKGVTMRANDMRQELISKLVASTGISRAFWDGIITRIVVDQPDPNNLWNWSVKTRCGHRNAPAIRRPMNEAIQTLRRDFPFVEPDIRPCRLNIRAAMGSRSNRRVAR